MLQPASTTGSKAPRPAQACRKLKLAPHYRHDNAAAEYQLG
jgi:hypothetical protein